MKYAKEFKLECVRKHKAGEYIETPGGCKRHTFMDAVREWVAIYDALGESGLEHRIAIRTWEEKLRMVEEVSGGASARSVALSSGIKADLLLKWCGIHRESGADGLKSMRRGRRPKMTEKPKKAGGPSGDADLRKELEYLRAENEYLKKLSALVRGRKGRRPRRK
ncbi:MAG: hypothetical protein ACI32C_03295 [Candidatus Enteromonas sp.]